jgi:Protein of unknown function (DUF3142)
MYVVRLTVALILVFMIAGAYVATRSVRARAGLRIVQSNQTLAHEAYIWQRRWTPAVGAGMQDLRQQISAWRVLAGQADEGVWRFATLDTQAIQRNHQPIRGVFRVNAARNRELPSDLLGQIYGWLGAMDASGIDVAGVEIDYDCSSAKLADYAHAIGQLKKRLPVDVILSVTSLPSWLTTSAFADVAQATDELVLQVHAVQSPPAALFDPAAANDALYQLSRQTDKPFWLALPTYQSVVSLNAEQQILGVESEINLPNEIGSEQITVQATPSIIQAYLRALRRAPPKNLRGIVWFRLGTALDRRAWPSQTLMAVIDDQKLRAKLTLISAPNGTNGSFDLLAVNRGNDYSSASRWHVANAACRPTQAVGNAQYNTDTATFFLDQSLPPGASKMLGWIVCPKGMTPNVEQVP